MAWEPGSPEYEAWRVQNEQKTGVTAPGFDRFGMPLATAAAPTTPPSGDARARSDAKAVMRQYLERLGLGSEADWAYGLLAKDAPGAQIELELRERPAYKRRFAGMEQLAKKGRAISEAQYLDLERTYAQMFRTYGLPAAMYDSPDDFARLIGGEVAPTEIRDRLQLASAAASQAPKEVRDELTRLYGVDQGALTAFFLDPDKALPVLTQQFAAGTLGATAKRTGYGALSRTEAERLASLGITEDTAAKGFSQLAASSELMGSLDATEDNIDRSVGQAAVFESNAAAIERLNRRAERRRAAFSGGGSFASDRSGISGLGSAAS